MLNLRHQFPLLKNNHTLSYLDSAASAQKPEVVLKAMDEFYRTSYANVHRGVYTLSEQATARYEATRGAVAKFLNAFTSEEIIFTKNATDALNLVASSLCQTLKTDDEILLTQLEHHANLVPWQQHAKLRGLKLKFFPITKAGYLDYTKLNEYITPGTKVVSVSGMSNVLGCITHLPSIIEAAHKVGAVVVVDAAQLATHKPIDVQALDCDFLAITGHKLFGPSGIGVLYGKKALLEELPPYQFGGSMINEVSWHDSTWAEVPAKFEAGTPPIAEAVGLHAAINFITELGWGAIQKHELEITEYGLEELKKINSLHLTGPQSSFNRGPVFSFTIDGVHPHDLASILDEHGVAVRAGHHCAMPLHKLLGLTATTRASFSIYNTKEDVDKLVEGIKAAQKILR